ncbi:MAG TPA: G1 family glutamic endopeptidase [Gaiellaceae bacterium]|nr:G1 family glutamic endopeptidase [Gaiellaceae bacterium]
MSRARLWAAALLLALACAGVAAGTGSAGTALTTEVSSNWAGYAVSGASSPFTSVSGSWTVPTATCTAGSRTYSAFWVGLGGFGSSSDSLEQGGTSSDCTAAGTARYTVWYELVPTASKRVRLSVRAGDVVSASVAVSGQTVVVHLRNVTRGTSFAKTLHMSSPDVSSAEWIAEAPSAWDGRSYRTLPLTDFGTVTFRRTTATAGGHTGTIADAAWTATAVELGGTSGGGPGPFAAYASSAGAVPGALSRTGSAFSVTWRQGTATLRP